ncbi:MAG: alpha-N-acetylglucosaminidase TIM-barrel domain-containing protein [Bacteroidota bacterium]
MKKFGLIAIIISLYLSRIYSQTDATQQIQAAQQLMQRVLKDGSKSFEFIKVNSSEGLDAYEVHAKNGKVKVSGSSTVAMCHGAYDYLRKACHFQFTWSSSSIPIPQYFPDFDIEKTTSPYQLRQYYNVCTYGYTMAFWGWDEWQHELDWMALHGINMPVAMMGQEAIWQKVWKAYGITDNELDNYFTGPAFLPWHRMGNVNKHGGPPPKSYYTKSVVLQKQVLQRMRELGMMPIVPAFSGYVPDAIKRAIPGINILDMKPWCGFDKDYGTHMLLPSEKQFTEIGKKFIDEYTKEFGKCKYYLADAFNEMVVPVKKDKNKELEEFGNTIYQSIRQADTDAVWVMQGWLFYNDKSFWDKTAVQSFLKDVPDDKMIIIDLANESFHGWQEQDGFYGKNWICSYIHNYGGKTQLGGDLQLFASDAPQMLATANHGKLCGFGISPEGINQNEVLYELLTDVAWIQKPFDLDRWIEIWCTSRYGKYTPEIKKAWGFLLKSIYGPNGYFAPNLYQQRPSLNPNHKIYLSENLDSAVNIFNHPMSNTPFSRMLNMDMNEVQSIYEGSEVDFFIQKALELYKKNEKEASQAMFGNAFLLMSGLDDMMNFYPEHNLETWVELARRWGNTPAEKDYYEEQAKRQITVWGGPVLSEYACKTWGGLIKSYYLPRWEMFSRNLFDHSADSITKWEEKWITTAGSFKNSTKEVFLNDPNIKIHSMTNRIPYLDYLSIHSIAQNEDTYLISIDSKDKNLDIYYTTDGKNPDLKSNKYSKPFTSKAPTHLIAQTYKEGMLFGSPAELNLSLSLNKTVTLKEEADGKYKADGGKTLTDGNYGTIDYTDGKWLGFEGKDMEALIDLGSTQKISTIEINYLLNTNSWIFSPISIDYESSEDGIHFKKLKGAVFCEPNKKENIGIYDTSTGFISSKARYMKIKVKSPKICPIDHPGAGQKCWIFIDEITVN